MSELDADVSLHPESEDADVKVGTDETDSSATLKRQRDKEEEPAVVEDDTQKKTKVDEENSAEQTEDVKKTVISMEDAAKMFAEANVAQPKGINATITTLSPPSSVQIVSTISPAGDKEVIEVSKEKVSQIIGSKGAIIKDMQMRTGAKIYIEQSVIPCLVEITGVPQQVKAASELVRRIISEGPTAIHVNSLAGGPSIQITMECDQNSVGKVIGSGGATIKEIQARSGARIQIIQDLPPGVPRQINISGTEAAVKTATGLVSYVMFNGPSLPPLAGAVSVPGASPYGAPAASPYGPGGMGGGGTNTHVMECQKPMVGRIIGRGGETINMIQQRSGTKMQIEQNVNPCKINITGTPQGIAIASQMITDLMLTGSLNPMGPPGGPMGGMGGYGMPPGGGYPGGGYQAPYGGMPPMMGGPQYGAPAYGQQPQPYGMQQPYGQAYGAPGGYGAPQQQGMGAYGAPGMGGYAPAAAPAPAPAAQKALPAPWSEHKTDDGNVYWYNSTTGVSQWERPV